MDTIFKIELDRDLTEFIDDICSMIDEGQGFIMSIAKGIQIDYTDKNTQDLFKQFKFRQTLRGTDNQE